MMGKHPLLARLLLWLAIALLLVLVGLGYQQPLLMQQLADQVWACF